MNHSEWFKILIKKSNERNRLSSFVRTAWVTFNFHETTSMEQAEIEAEIKDD